MATGAAGTTGTTGGSQDRHAHRRAKRRLCARIVGGQFVSHFGMMGAVCAQHLLTLPCLLHRQINPGSLPQPSTIIMQPQVCVMRRGGGRKQDCNLDQEGSALFRPSSKAG